MGSYTENGTYRFFKIAISAIFCVKKLGLRRRWRRRRD